MPTAPFVDAAGNRSEIELAPQVFGVQVNVPVMHTAVRAQLAAARAGTHSTKTRAEVRGGGRKPWRQKGTGRARHGSIREPQWVGGGVAHGPRPRDHSMRLNKKEKALALRSALSDRAGEGAVVVVEVPQFEEPKTKRAVELLETWGAAGKVLLVTGPDDEAGANAWKSFRNLPNVLMTAYPTTYTVLAADTVVLTSMALDMLAGRRGGQEAPSPSPAEPAAGPAPAEAAPDEEGVLE